MTDVAFIELAFQTGARQITRDSELKISGICECTPHSLVLEAHSFAFPYTCARMTSGAGARNE